MYAVKQLKQLSVKWISIFTISCKHFSLAFWIKSKEISNNNISLSVLSVSVAFNEIVSFRKKKTSRYAEHEHVAYLVYLLLWTVLTAASNDVNKDLIKDLSISANPNTAMFFNKKESFLFFALSKSTVQFYVQCGSWEKSPVILITTPKHGSLYREISYTNAIYLSLMHHIQQYLTLQ